MNALVILFFLIALITQLVHTAEPTCKIGQPLEGVFCGRGSLRQSCPTNYTCNIAKDDSYAVCCPNDPCDKCGSNERCEILKHSRARCIRCPMFKCRIFCRYGYMLDRNGCQMCRCFNPCRNCKRDEICRVEEQVKCVKYPCFPIGLCDSIEVPLVVSTIPALNETIIEGVL